VNTVEPAPLTVPAAACLSPFAVCSIFRYIAVS
jgi:hypothetical protein